MDIKFFEFPGMPNVRCVFCGRSDADLPFDGNISFSVGDLAASVRDCRFSLARALARHGMTAWSECAQAHGDTVIFEAAPTDAFAKPQTLLVADGMTASSPGLGLMIKTADCQPLLIADSSGSHIMALHVGWRGNRINFPKKAIEEFCDYYKLKPAEIWAVRGPSLGPAAAEFRNFDSEWGPEFQKWRSDLTECMNLWGLTRNQLESAGVPSHHIFGLDICTYFNDDNYFSYRREHGTGRQASLIWIKASPRAN